MNLWVAPHATEAKECKVVVDVGDGKVEHKVETEGLPRILSHGQR